MENTVRKECVTPPCAESTVDAADGVELFVRYYAAAGAAAPRTLLIVHGGFEHGGRYAHVATAAAERGWNTIVPDLRGHGRSGGPRAHVGRFADYVDDVEKIRSQFGADPQRTAMLGHSMGGLVAIRYAQHYRDRLAALAVIAPLLKVGKPPHPLTAALGRVLSVVAPRTRFPTGIEADEISRDPEIQQQWADDPLMQSTTTAGWYFEARFAMRKAWKKAATLDIPLLIMQGAMDRIVDPLATERWAEEAGGTDKTFQLFPDHVHELLNEPDRAETIASLLSWLEARVR